MTRIWPRRFPVVRVAIAAAIGCVVFFRHGPRAQPQELPPELLNRRVPYFTFRNESFSDVIGRVGQASGIRIDVDWPALAAVDLMPDQRITGSTYLGTVSDALEGVVERVDSIFWNVRYRCEPGRIVISTVADCAKPIECRAYDVRDLLGELERVTDSQGLKTTQWRFHWQPARASLAALPGLPGSGMHYPSWRPDAASELQALVMDRAAAAFSRLCAGADPPQKIAWIECGQLVVVGTPSAQQEVRALLQYLRRRP